MWLGTFARLVVAATIVTAMAGCGLLDPSKPAPQQVYGNPAELEKTEITVGALKTLDTATLHIARSEGLFGREGLNVAIEYVGAGPVGVDRLVADQLDITFTSYPPIFRAEHKNIGDFKIVSDATSLLPGNSVIMVRQDSDIDDVIDLRDSRIGVVGLDTMAHLLVLNTLRFNDITPDDVSYVEAKFEEIALLIGAGRLDAGFLTEPHVSLAKKNGLRELVDTHNGANEGIALCGYAAKESWVADNPKTYAAFSRAMQRAAHLARDKPWLVYEILPTYVDGLTVEDARLIRYTRYEPVANQARLQEVATLMTRFGMFGDEDRRDDGWTMGHMIATPAPLTSPTK